MGLLDYKRLNTKINARNQMQRARALYKSVAALSPFQYLARARDYSVRRITECAEMASYAGIVAAPGVGIAVPMSHSLNPTSFRDHDTNYRELMGGETQRETARRTRTRRKLYVFYQPFPRSFSTPLGHYDLDQLRAERIDEEGAWSFSGDEDILSPRRSCSALPSMNLHGWRKGYAL